MLFLRKKNHESILTSESAIAGHDGTLMVQNSRDRIFFGPGEAGVEKNCKVNPVSFYFFGNFGGSLFILKKNNWFSLSQNFDKHVIINKVMRSYIKYNTVINDYGHVERYKSGGSVFW